MSLLQPLFTLFQHILDNKQTHFMSKYNRMQRTSDTRTIRQNDPKPRPGVRHCSEQERKILGCLTNKGICLSIYVIFGKYIASICSNATFHRIHPQVNYKSMLRWRLPQSDRHNHLNTGASIALQPLSHLLLGCSFPFSLAVIIQQYVSEGIHRLCISGWKKMSHILHNTGQQRAGNYGNCGNKHQPRPPM